MVRALAIVALVAACGAYPNPPEQFCAMHPESCSDAGSGTVTIAGTVTGLNGASGLVLQNNGGDDKAIISDGAFTFATSIATGAAYDVTVLVEPTNPSELCTVTNGTGTANTNIGGVSVTCAPAAYTIGGNVFGLSGSLSLFDNSTDQLTSVMNGQFVFLMPVQSGQQFDVTSSSGSCPVFGGTGTVGNADVMTVVVNCSTTGPYAIGGTVSGLNGSVVLKNSSNGDMVTISSNGSYAFPMLVPSAGPYNVAVQTAPFYPPASQTCSVSNSLGNANGNVQNINVTCTTNQFTVGGVANGVAPTVVLQNNGRDNLSVGADGPFTFAMRLSSGTAYSVSVLQEPPTETCTLINSAGTVANGNVTGVSMDCGYNDPGILCGPGRYCDPSSKICCDPTGGQTCQSSMIQCAKGSLACDSKDDCGSNLYCCGDGGTTGTNLDSTKCEALGACTNVILCDPGDKTPCPSGKACDPWTGFTGYFICK
jgi:hypothetical protein